MNSTVIDSEHSTSSMAILFTVHQPGIDFWRVDEQKWSHSS